jgi:hypothetical protein
MKKILLLALICISTNVFAQKIKLTSGNLDFLKTEQFIDAEFTYENLNVGKMTEADYVEKKMAETKGDAEAWYAKWIADRETRYEPKFIELFDKYMEKRNISISSEGKYTMRINTFFIEPGFNVGVMRKNSAINLSISIVNKETNSEEATLSVINSSADNFWGGDFDAAYRIQESYAKAGRELAKFITKKIKD